MAELALDVDRILDKRRWLRARETAAEAATQ